jgi:hypothetical protein
MNLQETIFFNKFVQVPTLYFYRQFESIKKSKPINLVLFFLLKNNIYFFNKKIKFWISEEISILRFMKCGPRSISWRILFFKNFFIKLINRNIFFIFKKLFYKFLLIRPLLLFNRFEIKKFLFFWKLPVFPDKTNHKLKFHRNRIRYQLLPTLRFFFNRQIDNNFFSFVNLLNNENYYLNFLSTRLLTKIKQKSNKKTLLKYSLFFSIPIFIRKRIFKNI